MLMRESRGHGIWIAMWSVIGWVGTALLPVLNNHQFALMLLSPRAVFAAMATGSTSLVPFVLLGTARLCVTDASYYIIGRRAPATLAQAAQRDENKRPRHRLSPLRYTDRMCRALCRRPLVAGAILFLRPNGKYLAVAGAYGVSRKVAGLSAVAGTVLYLTAMHVGGALIF